MKIEIESEALDSLKRMVEELGKDAARYRWIRDAEGPMSSFQAAYYNSTNSDEIDAAVDEAIKQE